MTVKFKKTNKNSKLYLIEFRQKLYRQEVVYFTLYEYKAYKKAIREARLYNNVFKKNKDIIKSSTFKVKKYRNTYEED